MKSIYLINEAKEVKAFVEKNKALPKFCTINGDQYSIYTTAYMFSRLLSDLSQKNISVKNVSAPSTKFSGKINEKVLPSDYKDMNKRFSLYCELNKKIPAYVTTAKTKTQVPYDIFVYCMCKIIVFYFNNSKALPAYCLFNSSDIQNKTNNTLKPSKPKASSTSKNKKSTKKDNCSNPYTSKPHFLTQGCNKLGQCTGYFCGPHAIHQSMRKFGITQYTEHQIAAWAGTTTAGSGHPGINTAIAKISKNTGVKLSVQWKNFSDMGATDEERFKAIAKIICNPNKAVIWHIAYINGGSSINGKHFGHYEYIDKINILTKYVRALNSLGDKKADGSYSGRLQDRAYSVQAYFARNTPGNQPALCIITKG